jgi:hypothetical protein
LYLLNTRLHHHYKKHIKMIGPLFLKVSRLIIFILMIFL